MIPGVNAAGPIYPTMASRRDGTMREAISEQQRESMTSGPPVSIAFALHAMAVYGRAYL